MAVLATATIQSTSSSNVYINANNLRLRVGNTVVMTNDIGGLPISFSIAIAVIFGYVIESSSANMAFHFDIINNTPQGASATVRIVAFRIITGGVADSPTITPQANVWNVVGSLFRNAGNPEVAIGILFGGGGTTHYNTNTLAFRVNGSTTNQITNLVRAMYGGLGIFVFLRYDESNVRTYTVEAYGVPSTGYSLDAKIIAFSPGVVVRIHYQVASGGNPVMGHITMRYIYGATQRTIISTSPRAVV
ncbi:MAG: hypothetical protein NZ953_04480, partial [Thaumarchaeota archaeon]|nr:hypothetical protein [Candidatus Calditenuaceae archaeon]